MKYIPTFESFLNEAKMVIHPAMDKSVKTPWGKGGPRSIVVLGKTSSGLDVTLNGDFVDAKGGRYVTEPTDEDRKEAKEMVQFHYDRLTGGLNKEKLASVLHMFESFLNEGTKDVQKSYWLILNDPNKWAMEQFGHDVSKLSRGEQKEFDYFLELAKKNYKE